MKKYFVVFIAIGFTNLITHAQHFDHSIWETFLQKHVNADGEVNYKAIKANPYQLNTYLNQFTETVPNSTWKKNETLAYWINAYNAFTIKLIIDNYPIISIKDIIKPWDKQFIPLDEKIVSLNYIEHEILRKMNEPRIHFAIVCASYSCPKLSNTAYTSINLETQLTQATKDFLSDPERNIITENSIKLSKIFSWFEKDFKQNGSLIDFLNQYSNVTISKKAKKKYLDYNWNLNE